MELLFSVAMIAMLNVWLPKGMYMYIYLFFPVCFPLNTGFTGPWLTIVRHPSVRGKLIGSNLGGSGEKQQARLLRMGYSPTNYSVPNHWIVHDLNSHIVMLQNAGANGLTHFVICIDWPNFGDYNLDFQNLVINEQFIVCDQILGVM